MSDDVAPQGGIRAYVALTKPRIIEQLLITTLPTMFVAERGVPSLWLMFATLVGGTAAAGGANAFNMVIDRDIDRLMERTKGRPLVTGALTPKAAFRFALIIETFAFIWLWATVNFLAAVLAVAACLFYVFVYTLWLKRTSRQNIVIGGAAGAVPVLVGWAAVQNRITLAPILLFLVIFVWTPPHFWALAVKYREDYAAAKVPMMPVVASSKQTANQIVAYSVVMVALTLWFASAAEMGPFYAVSAGILGALFLGYAGVLHRDMNRGAVVPSDSGAGVQGTWVGTRSAMRLFAFSIAYLTLLFVAIAVDQVLEHGL